MTGAHRTLDRVNRSILFKNMAEGLKYREHCYITSATIKVPMCGAREVKNACRREVRGLCQRWARRGVMVFVKLQFVNKAAPSAISILGNTTEWGWRRPEEFG